MEATLKAVKRETRGKNEARRLRVAGQIPAVVYGGAQGAVRGDLGRAEGAVAHPPLGDRARTR